MKRGVVAFAAGLVFAAGLCLSGMTQPSKVTAFLDLAGRWDPSLAFVMIGAIAVTATAFWVSSRRAAPLLADRFSLPPARGAIDGRLLVGAAIFGVGWGLSGLCPGPAIVSLVSGQPGALVFVASMTVGMFAYRATDHFRVRSSTEERPSSAAASGEVRARHS